MPDSQFSRERWYGLILLKQFELLQGYRWFTESLWLYTIDKKIIVLSILHRTKIVLIGKLKNITYKRLQNLCCNTFSLTNYHGIIAWWLQPFTYICRQVQRTINHLSILCIAKLVGYCVFFRRGGYSRVLNHDESRWWRKKFSCLSLHSKILFIIFSDKVMQLMPLSKYQILWLNVTFCIWQAEWSAQETNRSTF